MTDAVFPVNPQLFDLSIMRIKKRMGVTVPSQTSDHAANTAVAGQIIEKASCITVAQRFLSHLSGDIVTTQFLLKKISDFRVPAYNVRIHVIVD